MSFLYEALQYVFEIGATDITDLLMNTLGGIAGAGLLILLVSILVLGNL